MKGKEREQAREREEINKNAPLPISLPPFFFPAASASAL
jgi:hypothetical protein